MLVNILYLNIQVLNIFFILALPVKNGNLNQRRKQMKKIEELQKEFNKYAPYTAASEKWLDGSDATISAIQSGELPLKALALPIEELCKGNFNFVLLLGKGKKQASIAMADSKFKQRNVEIFKASKFTHFLPLGGGDE
jgi:hypothetical protein